MTFAFYFKLRLIFLIKLLIEEPLFDTLRTKEKLGYNVYAQAKDTEGILGYAITVHSQATKFDPSYIDSKIEEFIEKALKQLEKLTDDKFQQYKNDLIKIKQLKEVHLEEEVEKFWSEIFYQDYMFDRSEQEVNALRNLTVQRLQHWLSDHVRTGTAKNFRKMSFQVNI